jgi:hypothetical protein
MKKKQILGAAGLVTAGILAGSIMSVAGAANAATDTTASGTTSSSSSTATTTPPTFGGANGAPAGTNGQAPADFNPGGAASVRSDETQVTGSDADRLKAAAEARVSGATAFRVETDGDGAAYEVHMKKADGSLVTVKFDSSFNITSVEDGMGAGGPGGHGGPGDHDGDGPAGAPGQAPTTGSSTGTTN